MGGLEWSPEEDALVVFFASLGVFGKVVAELLTQRGYNRSLPAVRNRTTTLKNAYGLGEARRWDQDTVEEWLSRYLRTSHVAVNKLQPTVADQTSVQQAQASIDLQSAYNRLSQRLLQDLQQDLQEDWQQDWMGTTQPQWPHGGGGYYS